MRITQATNFRHICISIFYSIYISFFFFFFLSVCLVLMLFLFCDAFFHLPRGLRTRCRDPIAVMTVRLGGLHRVEYCILSKLNVHVLPCTAASWYPVPCGDWGWGHVSGTSDFSFCSVEWTLCIHHSSTMAILSWIWFGHMPLVRHVTYKVPMHCCMRL